MSSRSLSLNVRYCRTISLLLAAAIIRSDGSGATTVMIAPVGSSFSSLHIKGDYSAAKVDFECCLEQKNELGKTVSGMSGYIAPFIGITDCFGIEILFDEKGVYIALVEVLQKLNQYEDAASLIRKRWGSQPYDADIRLSLLEIEMTSPSMDQLSWSNVVALSDSVKNDSVCNANMLYLRAHALLRLGYLMQAEQCLSEVLSDLKWVPDELLLRSLFLRSEIYERNGDIDKASKDLERICSRNSKFRDAETRLARIRATIR